MAKNDNKVLMIYYDSEVLVNALPDEQAGKVFKSLFLKYADGKEPLEMSDAARMVFLALSNTIDRQIADYEERNERHNQANERRSQYKKAYWESKNNEAEPQIEVKEQS